MRVAIVGGGLIGLFAAYHLARRGVDVVVLERNRIGAACSRANAGWITPSISVPVPAPHVREKSLRWLLSPSSPLYIRPSAMLGLAPWLWTFWKHCNPVSFEFGCRALARLGAGIMKEYDQLESAGLQFEQRRSGLLMVFAKQSDLDAQSQQFERAGYGPLDFFGPKQLQAKEPALTGRYAGAIHVLAERHLRPERLCASIAAAIRTAGVEIREGIEVRDFVFTGRRAESAATSAGSVTADRFLIATGAEAARLAGCCGTKLPIQAGKGYSVTVANPATEIQAPIYLSDAKIGLSPFRNALRVAGTMELSGINLHLDRRRIAALRRGAQREVPGIFDGGTVTEWVGMRPLTPDGLPVVGRLPSTENVFVASGHQMVGVKLAPTTGRLLSELIVDGRSSLDLGPFAPDRFT